MKKYLLLASVAGCLMANNAMAAGNIGTDAQSVNIDASVELVAAHHITGFEDIDFGKVVLVDQPEDGDGIAYIGYDSEVTGYEGTSYIPPSNTGQTAVVCTDANVNLVVTCAADGSEASASNVCEFAEGLGIRYEGLSGMSIQYCQQGDYEERGQMALVKVGDEDLSTGSYSGAALVVTLDY